MLEIEGATGYEGIWLEMMSKILCWSLFTSMIEQSTILSVLCYQGTGLLLWIDADTDKG
jgi:hypothetical protein